MREQAVITLKKPLRGHGGQEIKRIVLREPTFDEYLIHGDPYTVAASSAETRFAVENLEVIKQYISICLVEPKDPQLLSAQGNARLAREVKQKLLDFFQPEAETEEGSETSQTNSPSGHTGETASTTSSG